jgi:hypothetical protein
MGRFPGRVVVTYVKQPQSDAELEAMRRNVERGQPYGGDARVRATVARLVLEFTLRQHGRPREDA